MEVTPGAGEKTSLIMNTLVRRDDDLSALYAESGSSTITPVSGAANRMVADSIIHVELGPHVRPSRIRILRSAWPTVTALNFAEGREFHMRLRRHTPTGIYLVYGSVTLPTKEVRQRGHLCRTIADVERIIPLLRRELQIEKPGLLK